MWQIRSNFAVGHVGALTEQTAILFKRIYKKQNDGFINTETPFRYNNKMGSESTTYLWKAQKCLKYKIKKKLF